MLSYLFKRSTIRWGQNSVLPISRMCSSDSTSRICRRAMALPSRLRSSVSTLSFPKTLSKKSRESWGTTRYPPPSSRLFQASLISTPTFTRRNIYDRSLPRKDIPKGGVEHVMRGTAYKDDVKEIPLEAIEASAYEDLPVSTTERYQVFSRF